jgi:hypothetical protein
MQRNTLEFVTFAIALSLFATPAHGWPLGRVLHLHPAAATAKDSGISFALFNKSGVVQDVTVAGRKYTLVPNSTVTITAPEGTQVISDTEAPGHKKGDVLFAVTASLRNDTLIIH